MTSTAVLPALPVSESICNSNRLVRSYCTCCGTKQYRSQMKLIYYKLLKRSAWHCLNCLSTAVDNLQFDSRGKRPYLIELFAGSKTVASTAMNYGFETFTVDIEKKFNPDLVADIQNLKVNHIPGSADSFIIWASIPCTYYSILNIGNHWEKLTYASRKYYYIPKTKEARSAIKLLEKTLYIIRKINPVYFFIENPRGALRHQPQMAAIPFIHTVSYSDYGLDIYKPTDIFTNCPFLQLCELKTSVGRKFKNSVLDLPNPYERSKVPTLLIESILNQITTHHQIVNRKS